MSDSQVSVSGRGLVASGTIVCSSTDIVTIPIKSSTETIAVVFKFVQDDVDPSTRVNGAANGTHQLDITLINFNSPLGQGQLLQEPIGTLDNHALYLNFVVYGIAEMKTLQYMLTRG